MSKKVYAVITSLGLAAPFMALAQINLQTVPIPNQSSGVLSNGLPGLLNKIATIFAFIVLGLSVIYILYAALTFITAAGEAEKITQARSALIYALIGIAVALLAFAAPTLVSSVLGQS